MTNQNALEVGQAVSARSHTPAPPLACGRTLHFGFFFDGFGRNLEEDLKENRVSNIGKLFLAHELDAPNAPSDEFYAYRKSYLSGLGAAFDTSLGVQAGGTLNRAVSEVADIPGDIAGEQALKGARDGLTGRSWWQRMQREVGSLADKPWKALKTLRDTLLNSAAEALEPIRDSRWSAALLKTGVDTRLEGALAALNREITHLNSGQMPLRTIKVSVFGFDFGATLARAFVHMLLERSQQRDGYAVYRNARLEIIFAGLFDAVDRTAASVPPLEFFLPTTNVVEDGGLMPAQVRSVLHLVAAHERRFYRRVRLLGDARRGWREVLMPGVSEDIGGGIAPGEQKPSNELALVSLHQMYRAASSAGASLVPMEMLPAKGRVLASLFTYNDRTPSRYNALGLARRYQDWVGRGEPGHDAFLHHMKYYIRWLAHVWHAYHAELAELDEREEQLYQSQFVESSTLARLFRVSGESAAQRQQRVEQTREIQQRRRQLHAEFRWLQDVDKEARDMRSRAQAYGVYAAPGQQAREIWEVLLGEWFQPQPLQPEIAELFGYFVHDLLVPSPLQRVGSTWFGGEDFFAIRGFDRPRGKQPAVQQTPVAAC